ncbi:MAG: response regulator [Stagnimonas sp.]|nr:response regulator [Stagnimonas sp.]
MDARPTDATRLLIVDDDAELRRLLASYFERRGWHCFLRPDGSDLPAAIARHAPHALVLDLMMPGDDGLTVLKRLRATGEEIPVVMLTARDETSDRILGLELGADDYLGKPFDPRELQARIEAVLRRKSAAFAPGSTRPLRFGAFVFDPAARTLRRDGEALALTSAEFDLLAVLIRHAGKPMKRERLLQLTEAGESEAYGRAIDVRILRLRRALGEDAEAPRHIRTVRGAGYVFVADAAA